MSNPSKQKRSALFLDRDGVLIQRADLTWKKVQLKISNKIAPLLCKFNQKNIPVIVRYYKSTGSCQRMDFRKRRRKITSNTPISFK